jgi:GST-like protein
MSRWQPRRTWFEAHCPKLAGIAKRIDDVPGLIPVWERNFPKPAVPLACSTPVP